MKDNLEKYISENREAFDMLEPSNDLWNKINTTQERRKVIRMNTRVVWRAAAVILIFLSGFIFQEIRYNSSNSVEKEQMAESEEIVIPELQETEAFFAHKVSDMMNEIQIYAVNDPAIMEEVQYDISELDSVYVDLKRDLKDNVANDEVIEAMIQNYRLKIRILEDLLTELKEINDENTTNESVGYEL